MTVIGYARVSTADQNLEVQEAALQTAGCDLIRSEKRSGTTTAGREELRTVLDFLRNGDVLMVTRIDRLARSIADLQDIVRTVRSRGAALRAL
jgi:DNA invertase Pin-like site-specific DNA recombinase